MVLVSDIIAQINQKKKYQCPRTSGKSANIQGFYNFSHCRPQMRENYREKRGKAILSTANHIIFTSYIHILNDN